MSELPEVRTASAPPLVGAARGLILRLCTSNPFYVLSAGLFLAGLRASFEAPAGEAETWALMTGLTGYTLLLAVAAGLLVRFGNVWDDVRTVLLLVVLMFLATSVTFDEVLVLSPERGLACCLGGLLFAVTVSEGILRGIRLALPGWFRAAYYFILALFFLYPLAVSALVNQPHSESLMWALFGFSPAAGLVFLTLLPAIRRGPNYVRVNGSPWRWPLYPWVLFGVLGFAVPARAFLLCSSMHLLPVADKGQVIFGPYFLVPFALAVVVLLLEGGLVARCRTMVHVALVAPVVLIGLALVGHRPEPIYQEFFVIFTARLGGDPLYLTLLATAGFYLYAALRRVPLATEALTVALVALAVVGPDTLKMGPLHEPRPLPILAVAALQTGLGLCRRNVWRCAVGAAGLVIGTTLSLPEVAYVARFREAVAFHLALLAMLSVGAAFKGRLGQMLRDGGAVLVLLVGLVAIFGEFGLLASFPPWVVAAYAPAMAALLAAYGLLLGHRLSLGVAALVLACWVGRTGWSGYRGLREVVVGLDHIALGLALFGVAFLVSLGKSGILTRWLAARSWLVRPVAALNGSQASVNGVHRPPLS